MKTIFMTNKIQKIIDEFDDLFSDKEGCQKGGDDCGKRVAISGNFLCSSCEKWGGMEGAPKDWKRLLATSKQIKQFLIKSLNYYTEEIIKEIKENIEIIKNKEINSNGRYNACIEMLDFLDNFNKLK